MKTVIRLVTVVAEGFLAVHVAAAQAPAGSTGQCKDGTYSTAVSKQGACRGHQGVKEWYTAAPASTPGAPKIAAPPATPAAVPAPASKPSPASKAASMPQAAGGGPGLVWVNASSNVYHCYGSDYYGRTKAGSYMSEADAKAKGSHADHNHPCTK
jgi:hypothetical protein